MKWLQLLLSITVCLLVGGVSGYFTADAIPGWYATLQKPSFNPPNWIFGPVWTTLYILMAIAFWLIWTSKAPGKKTAMLLFGIQLTLNFFWSIIFFNAHAMGWALVEIIALWMFILLSILTFYPISKTAAWLLVPYLLWVSFASVLNFSLWRLNPPI